MTPEQMAAIHAEAMTTARPWNTHEFKELLQSPNTITVTEDSGFALGRVIADEAELLTIAVAAISQRTGQGTRLLTAFEAEIVERGATKAFLEVAADNPAAIALYSKSGWVQSGLRPRYYTRKKGLAVDALLLTKTVG